MVRITVIIPTQDRKNDLIRCLEALQMNEISFLEEIIIVDDASKEPLKIDGINLPISILRNEQPIGAAASRNRAASNVTAKIIAFLDDDAVPTPDWLTNIITNLTESRGGITGRVLRFDHGVISEARQARYDKRYSELHTYDCVNFFSGGNSAVWTELFQRVGGFSDHGSGGDNVLVNDLKAIGFEVFFVSELVILHRNSKGLKKAILDAYRSGLKKNKKETNLYEYLREVFNFTTILYKKSLTVTLLNWMLNVIHVTAKLNTWNNQKHK